MEHLSFPFNKAEVLHADGNRASGAAQIRQGTAEKILSIAPYSLGMATAVLQKKLPKLSET